MSDNDFSYSKFCTQNLTQRIPIKSLPTRRHSRHKGDSLMKFISLIITILIIGFIVKKQLNSNIVNKDAINQNNIGVPKVPTAPEDVHKFKEDINKFMENTEDKRDEEIDKLLNN